MPGFQYKNKMDFMDTPEEKYTPMLKNRSVLAIDCGNTNIKLGIFSESELVVNFRIATDLIKTSDEYAALIRSLLAGEGDAAAFDGVVLSSVVPPVTPMLERAAAKVTRQSCLVVNPRARSGVAIRVDHPEQLGADLLCLAAGAAVRHPLPAIVVSFGTATAFVAVGQPAEILGVAIAPGILSSAHALSAKAAQLPEIDLASPKTALGRDTVAAMRAGMVYGFAGLVDRVIAEMSREMGGAPAVIATGGLLNIISRVTETPTRYDPFLSLHGLYAIWKLNQTPPEASAEPNVTLE